MVKGLAAVAVVAAAAAAGCAGVGSIEYGRASAAPLVRLVVTTDRAAVERECDVDPSLTLGRPVWGCRVQIRVGSVRTVKVVRWTDAMPGPRALEIEAHELCHVVAGLQGIADPCHAGNGGALTVR